MNNKNSEAISGNLNEAASLFDVVVRLEKLPVDGAHIKISPSPEQLQKLAKILKVSSVESFTAKLHVFKQKPGIGLSGHLVTKIIQPCVITLAPVSQKIELQLQSSFVPKAKKRQDTSSENSEIYVDLQASSIVDEYEGNELDLEPFLLESLGLEIDLYPRANGAAMSDELAGDDPSELSPFSALKGLKDN
ncbi:MAG: DUF177 domain-containing protein [Devosiaceae bacterium]|nr:DUF177 domain-containing protein [Devosiaceae bacterium]